MGRFVLRSGSTSWGKPISHFNWFYVPDLVHNMFSCFFEGVNCQP
jgi:hypothetical protein